MLRAVARAQSAYFLATGVWPLVHRRSFEDVTGEKTDFWLVRVVGGLTAVLGLELARGVRRRDVGRSRLLALASAPVYAAADLHAGRRYSRIYFGDLVLQALFAAVWLAGARPSPRSD